MRAARAIENNQPAIFFAVMQNLVDHWTQWGKPDSTCDNHNIPAFGLLHRPAFSKWTSYANGVPHSPAYQHLGCLTDGAHGVHQMVVVGGVAADGNWDLADTEYPQHAELSWVEPVGIHSIRSLQRQGKSIGGLFEHLLNGIRLREHRLDGGCHDRSHRPTA